MKNWVQTHFRTKFHPQTDGQSKRTIKVLKDMMRQRVIEFCGDWDKFQPLCDVTPCIKIRQKSILLEVVGATDGRPVQDASKLRRWASQLLVLSRD